MFFKRNVSDYLSDDPIIRSDITGKILNFAEIDGAGTDRSELKKESIQPDRLLTSTVKVTASIAVLLTLPLSVLAWLKR